MTSTGDADRAAFHVYDTTLRDGAQQEGLSLSVTDKLTIAAHLDALGMDYIEGGWPGAMPKDTEFFERARHELDLQHATLAAFGATRRPGGSADTDPLVAALVDSAAPVVTLVAKSHLGHVERALRTTGEENLAMIEDTVSYLVGLGRRVFLDCEHFFDGYVLDAAYALSVVRTAADAGAEVVVLCDTNGGSLPTDVYDTVRAVAAAVPQAQVGIHCHDDTGCAVANTLAAVDAGAMHVQGTVNGYGERTGNANLLTVVADLQLKRGRDLFGDRMRELSRVAHAIAEITNVPLAGRQPYVGASAFAHKAGLHASAIKVDPDLYQHIDPARVGNDMRMLVSEMAGRASVELKGRELGFDLDDRELVGRVTDTVKEMEARGYTFEAADASFDLLLRSELDGAPVRFFDVESWRVITDSSAAGEAASEATVRLVAGGNREIVTAEGNGPVNALDAALRQAVVAAHPLVDKFELVDYRVRILDQGHGTDAVIRVLIDTADGEGTWTTVGVGHNIIEASWQALLDGVNYGLLRHGETPAAASSAPAPVISA